MDIENKISQQVLDFVKKQTGAKAVIIITSNSKIPCEKELIGEKCETYQMGILSDGISRETLPEVLYAQGDMVFNMIEEEDQKDIESKSTPSPYI